MNVKFQTETQRITADGALRKASKDEKGWYPRIPVFMFNTTSRNGWSYDPKYIVNALTSQDRYFQTACREGSAHGEFGHPDFSSCTTPAQVIMRMTLIDKMRMSHIMKNGVIVGNANGEGGVFCVDIKPHGPNAEYIRTELESPDMNATFSARTILTQDIAYHRNMRNPRRVQDVPTFDNVSLNGFSGASKRGQLVDKFTLEGYSCKMVDSESLDVSFTLDDMNMVAKVVTTESVTSGLLLDAMMADVVQVKREHTLIGTYEPGDKSIRTHAGRCSLIHQLFHNKDS